MALNESGVFKRNPYIRVKCVKLMIAYHVIAWHDRVSQKWQWCLTFIGDQAKGWWTSMTPEIDRQDSTTINPCSSLCMDSTVSFICNKYSSGPQRMKSNFQNTPVRLLPIGKYLNTISQCMRSVIITSSQCIIFYSVVS